MSRLSADRDEESFAEFCEQYGLGQSVEAAPLYLTFLADQGAEARAISRVIANFDRRAVEQGDPRWSATSGVAQWLSGFLRHAHYGRTTERAAPLYEEQVIALAEACLAPTREQRLKAAAVILANETGLPATALAQLRWRHVRLRDSAATISPPDYAHRGARRVNAIELPARSGPTCPVHALRNLRDSSDLYVLDGTGSNTTDRQRVGRYLAPLPRPARGGYRERKRLPPKALARLITDLLAPAPQSARDLALFSLSHAAALRGREALTLSQGDVVVRDGFLRLAIPGRRERVFVEARPSAPHCPVEAWNSWATHLAAQSRSEPDNPTFLRVSGSRIWDRAMIPAGLNYAIDQRARQALLTDRYVFTSLRTGAIRGWIRSGRPDLLIARDAGLLSLTSVARHAERERMLTHSVAGMVGL